MDNGKKANEVLIRDGLSKIIHIYNQFPQGFRSGAEILGDFGNGLTMEGMYEGDIRKFGETLHGIGGLELMKQTFLEFAEFADWPKHVPTDLVMVWDGIGNWEADALLPWAKQIYSQQFHFPAGM